MFIPSQTGVWSFLILEPKMETALLGQGGPSEETKRNFQKSSPTRNQNEKSSFVAPGFVATQWHGCGRTAKVERFKANFDKILWASEA